jgi:TrmH family RNA methyltransferase
MNSLDLNRFKLLLVGTKIPENIGGVARLLENYLVGEAGLVSPQCIWKEGVAQWMATGPSIERLNALPVYSNLSEAVLDCNSVVGFTARAGTDRKTSIKLSDLGKTLPGKVALVFGREDFCLLKEEIDLCTHLCALDTAPHFPALNLSHSVAVVLSHLFTQENNSRRGHFELATTSELDPLFHDLRESMIKIGLNRDGNPERMLVRMRKIFQRASLTRDDISLLRGYFLKVIKSVGGSLDQ